MSRSSRLGCASLFVLLPWLAACASMPAVESRLQSMRVYPNMYVVQPGDSLDSVAWRYQLSREQLIALNPGVESGLAPRQRLNVRPGTTLPTAVRVRQPYATRAPQAATVEAAIRGQGTALNTSSPSVVVTPIPDRPSLAAVPQQALRQAAPLRSQDQVQTTWPAEEVIPDTLDQQSVEVAVERQAMDRELEQFVGAWVWPAGGEIAREFAPDEPGGQGVDIAGVPGQDVHAAMAGTVVYSGRDLSGGGNLVIVRHPDNLMTTYSHTDNLYVAEDDRVSAGDAIASLGWNDDQQSVLRFEVRRDGNPLNPLDFLPVR